MSKLSDFWEWIVYRGSRSGVTGLFVLLFFLIFVALGVADATPLRQAMRTGSPVTTLFYGLLTALITGVTLVVTINQLVLSQELGPLGDQAERMEGSLSFREDVEAVISDLSSAEPSEFLGQLLDSINDKADSLHESLEGRDVESSALEHLDEIRGDSGEVAEELRGSTKGRLETILLSLNYEYDQNIHKARKLRKEYSDIFEGDEEEKLHSLEDAMKFYGPAREHIKTLYFQWELVNLSKRILYIAIPSTLVSSAIVLYLDASSLPGSLLGIDNMILIVSAAATLGLTPFILLATYILRVGTIARKTLAIGPFTFGDIED